MQGFVWRFACVVLGVAAAALGCYGACTFGLRLEGGVSYLTIAAPVVALAAALIPPIAEQAWRSRQHVKSLLWWLALVPAGLTAFFGAAERVHVAKAGAQAERQALRNDASRASKELAEAQAEARTVQAQVLKAEVRKTCNASCREAKAARDLVNSKVDAAKRSLLLAETKATTDSALMAPEWLLPSALDLIAFMAIWTGLTGPNARPIAGKPKARTKRKAKARAKANLKPVRPTDLDHLRLVK
jgi:hypothetical protein